MSKQADYDFLGPLQLWDGELWCPVCEASVVTLSFISYVHEVVWSSYSHMRKKHPEWKWDLNGSKELEA